MTLDESSIIQHRYSDGTFMMDVWTVIDGHQCPTINAVLIKLTVDIEAPLGEWTRRRGISNKSLHLVSLMWKHWVDTFNIPNEKWGSNLWPAKESNFNMMGSLTSSMYKNGDGT